MADYNSLKATIDANIRANGVQAITGPVLNACLKAMITVLGNGYQLQGSIAQPGDDPSVPDARVAYVASGPGTYTDFGGLVIPDDGHAYMLTWDTQWTAVQLPVPTSAALSALATVVAGKQDILTFDPSPVSGSLNPVTSGGIFSAIEHAKGAAGLAEALLDTDSEGAEQEFSLRKSGGDGGAYFRRLLGNTKAFNQLVQARASTTALSLTLTNNGDGSISITGTADTTTNLTISTLFARATGSRYFCSVGAPIGASQQVSVGGTPFSAGATMGIYTAGATGNVSMAISVVAGETYNLKLWPVVIDLTAMQDNSATPEEFREKYPLLYYAYGRKLIHNKVAKVITKGANQWDEVWELGSINLTTGENQPTTTYARSKNYIPIFPSTLYYFKKVTGAITYVFYYDAEKNYLGYRDPFLTVGSGGTFTTIEGAVFMRFYYRDTTYNNDICINLSDAEINGQYFPYWERELALDITNQEDTDGNKPFAEGMMGAGSAADYANEVGGAKVMGVVDLGDLEWTVYTPSYPTTYRALVPKATGVNNIVCSGYSLSSASSVTSLENKECVGSSASQYIYIRDDNYSNDAAAFKTAVTGQELVYELATPVPFTWKEPLNTGIKVSKYGTEEITPAQTENIDNAPFRAVTTYSISVANLVAALSALGNRGGAKGLLGSGNQGENPENEELTPEEESPKEEAPKEEETPVVEPIPEVQSKK